MPDESLQKEGFTNAPDFEPLLPNEICATCGKHRIAHGEPYYLRCDPSKPPGRPCREFNPYRATVIR